MSEWSERPTETTLDGAEIAFGRGYFLPHWTWRSVTADGSVSKCDSTPRGVTVGEGDQYVSGPTVRTAGAVRRMGDGTYRGTRNDDLAHLGTGGSTRSSEETFATETAAKVWVADAMRTDASAAAGWFNNESILNWQPADAAAKALHPDSILQLALPSAKAGLCPREALIRPWQKGWMATWWDMTSPGLLERRSSIASSLVGMAERTERMVLKERARLLSFFARSEKCRIYPERTNMWIDVPAFGGLPGRVISLGSYSPARFAGRDVLEFKTPWMSAGAASEKGDFNTISQFYEEIAPFIDGELVHSLYRLACASGEVRDLAMGVEESRSSIRTSADAEKPRRTVAPNRGPRIIGGVAAKYPTTTETGRHPSRSPNISEVPVAEDKLRSLPDVPSSGFSTGVVAIDDPGVQQWRALSDDKEVSALFDGDSRLCGRKANRAPVGPPEFLGKETTLSAVRRQVRDYQSTSPDGAVLCTIPGEHYLFAEAGWKIAGEARYLYVGNVRGVVKKLNEEHYHATWDTQGDRPRGNSFHDLGEAMRWLDAKADTLLNESLNGIVIPGVGSFEGFEKVTRKVSTELITSELERSVYLAWAERFRVQRLSYSDAVKSVLADFEMVDYPTLSNYLWHWVRLDLIAFATLRDEVIRERETVEQEAVRERARAYLDTAMDRYHFDTWCTLRRNPGMTVHEFALPKYQECVKSNDFELLFREHTMVVATETVSALIGDAAVSDDVVSKMAKSLLDYRADRVRTYLGKTPPDPAYREVWTIDATGHEDAQRLVGHLGLLVQNTIRQPNGLLDCTLIAMTSGQRHAWQEVEDARADKVFVQTLLGSHLAHANDEPVESKVLGILAEEKRAKEFDALAKHVTNRSNMKVLKQPHERADPLYELQKAKRQPMNAPVSGNFKVFSMYDEAALREQLAGYADEADKILATNETLNGEELPAATRTREMTDLTREDLVVMQKFFLNWPPPLPGTVVVDGMPIHYVNPSTDVMFSYAPGTYFTSDGDTYLVMEEGLPLKVVDPSTITKISFPKDTDSIRGIQSNVTVLDEMDEAGVSPADMGAALAPMLAAGRRAGKTLLTSDAVPLLDTVHDEVTLPVPLPSPGMLYGKRTWFPLKAKKVKAPASNIPLFRVLSAPRFFHAWWSPSPRKAPGYAAWLEEVRTRWQGTVNALHAMGDHRTTAEEIGKAELAFGFDREQMGEAVREYRDYVAREMDERDCHEEMWDVTTFFLMRGDEPRSPEVARNLLEGNLHESGEQLLRNLIDK